MNYYIEMELFKDTEITLGFMWKKFYTQVHLALVEVRDENNLISIGVSFPNYKEGKFPLGEKLRLFAKTKEELEQLNLTHWLERLMDYVNMSEIQKVPADANKFVSFSRKRFKSNSEIRRLAKRYAKRENITQEKALKRFVDTEEKYEKAKKDNKLPYINMQSLSSNQELKIFIDREEREECKGGLFSTYGLSHESTVPSF